MLSVSLGVALCLLYIVTICVSQGVTEVCLGLLSWYALLVHSLGTLSWWTLFVHSLGPHCAVSQSVFPKRNILCTGYFPWGESTSIQICIGAVGIMTWMTFQLGSIILNLEYICFMTAIYPSSPFTIFLKDKIQHLLDTFKFSRVEIDGCEKCFLFLFWK